MYAYCANHSCYHSILIIMFIILVDSSIISLVVKSSSIYHVT